MSTTRKPTVRQLGPRDHGPHGVTAKLRAAVEDRRDRRRAFMAKVQATIAADPDYRYQAKSAKDRSLPGKARIRARRAAQKGAQR